MHLASRGFGIPMKLAISWIAILLWVGTSLSLLIAAVRTVGVLPQVAILEFWGFACCVMIGCVIRVLTRPLS